MNKRELGLLEITAVIGAIASIFGVWTWFGSAQERRENEEIRRVELVDRAKTILEAESEDGIFENSTNVNWAFRTLARYGGEAKIEVQTVNLIFADLRCVSLDIEAESIEISNSLLVQTYLDVGTSNTRIEDSLGTSATFVYDLSANDEHTIEINDSVFNDLRIFSLTSKIPPKISFSSTLISQLTVTSISRTYNLERPHLLNSPQFNAETCEGGVIMEANGIEFVDCILPSSISQIEFVEGKDEWISEQPGIRLFGEPEPFECLDRNRIPFSESPFRLK